jgi:hypothetical protein
MFYKDVVLFLLPEICPATYFPQEGPSCEISRKLERVNLHVAKVLEA